MNSPCIFFSISPKETLFKEVLHNFTKFSTRKKPVKGFPTSLAELSLSESKIKQDVNQLYERLCVLVECGFTDRDLFLADMLKYLARNLNNEAHLKRCIDIAEYLKDISSKVSWVQEGFDKAITLANQKLGNKK